jgi:hypothetical protein
MLGFFHSVVVRLKAKDQEKENIHGGNKEENYIPFGCFQVAEALYGHGDQEPEKRNGNQNEKRKSPLEIGRDGLLSV